MRARLALLALVVLAATAAPAPAAAPALERALGSALASPYLDPRATAALAVDLRTGETVFARNADLALAPASAEKLAVSLAALRVLGPGYRFSTDVAGGGRRAGGVWHGHLFLVGHGDPTLGLPDLEALAREVAARGIRRVTGSVVGDESHFDARRGAPGWKPSYLGNESPPLSALAVAGVRVPRPNASALVAARAFAAALRRQGVTVASARVGRAPPRTVLLARDLSEPLGAVVRRMNAASDNFVAELVLKELGATVDPWGSSVAGARVVRRALAELGVPLTGVRVADGSGLSQLDRLTARALVGILRAGWSDRALRKAFVSSLAVAGVSGTMESRLATRPTRGRVLAKTGTTNRASSLAGFVGRRYAFAVVQNGRPVAYWAARAAQDRFVTVLARRS
jgi:D-alanyl-D-alanine carboxypeptidase/D-alanyl-D-alanine-endopeptidase (penicillin-binding protein 4)